MSSHRLPVALCAALLFVAPAVDAELTQRQTSVLENRVLPAYRAGNGSGLLESIHGLIAPLDETGQADANQFLKQAGMPSLGTMILEARIRIWQNSGSFQRPKPHPKEVILLLPALQKMTKTVLQDVRGLPVMADKLPVVADLTAYDKLFYGVHHAQNQAGFSVDIIKQSVALMRVARIQRLKLSPKTRKSIQSDYSKLLDELSALHQATKERDIEMRLQRLRHSVTTLDKSSDMKQRVLAAHYVDNDGMTLREVFKQQAKARSTPFARSSLNDKELPAETEALIERGHALAGDLRGKARLFATGMYWWLRGRYGRGPVFHGLVKSELALRSPKARAQVYMPKKLPRKNDSSNGPTYPDRRHHYTWQWEERTLQVVVNGSTRSLRPTKTGPAKTKPVRTGSRSATKLVSFSRGRGSFGGGGGGGSAVGARGPVMHIPRGTVYGPISRPYSYSVADVYKKLGYGDHYKKMVKDRKKYRRKRTTRPATTEYTTQIATYIPKQDPNLIYRVVGAYEYRNALECFDGLVRYCSKEELDAFDELIKERDEFEIETNLSRHIDHPPSPLDEQPSKPDDRFLRRGLRWVTALARAELAAMQLGFAADQDSFQRFAVEFDRAAYTRIVLDGMRSHYWSLTNDEGLRAIMSGGAGANRTLAYYRRLLVAKGFLDAGAFLVKDALTPAQKAEMLSWRQKLVQSQELLAKRIKSFHRQTVVRERR